MLTMAWLAREPARHRGGFFLEKISSKVLRLVRRFLLKFYGTVTCVVFFLSFTTTGRLVRRLLLKSND